MAGVYVDTATTLMATVPQCLTCKLSCHSDGYNYSDGYRRGAKEADELILELVRIADAVRGDTNKHMAHEEQEVLPLLEAHLCAAEQRAMVWRTLRAMPLRLLERVMPWVAGMLTVFSEHYRDMPENSCVLATH